MVALIAIVAVIRSVVDIYNKAWSSIFKDFRDAKMIVLEWEKERRGKYESEETWDNVIEKMYEIEMCDSDESIKIQVLMSDIGQIILCNTSTFPKKWMIEQVSKTRNKINYYKNNPEEEE